MKRTITYILSIIIIFVIIILGLGFLGIWLFEDFIDNQQNFLVDIFKLVLNISLLISSLYLIFIFKDAIQPILFRIVKFYYGNLKLELYPDSVQQQEKNLLLKKEVKTIEDLVDIPGINRNEEIGNIEISIYNMLEKIEVDKKIDTLVIALAHAWLKIDYEQIYRIIFGSQIQILTLINENLDINLIEAEGFFNKYKTTYPNIYKNFNFDNWIGFLTCKNLIQNVSEKLKCTVKGKNFLIYITDQGLNAYKGE